MNESPIQFFLSHLYKSKLLLVIGSIMLFASWSSQSIFEAYHRDKVSDMHRLQVAIDIAQVRLELWSFKLLEQKSKNYSNPEIALGAALKALQAKTNIDAWSKGRLAKGSEEIQAIYNAKDKKQKKAKALYSAGKLSLLIEQFEAEVKTANDEQRSNSRHESYIDLRNETSSQATKARVFFVVFYALGSIFFAVHWCLGNRKNDA